MAGVVTAGLRAIVRPRIENRLPCAPAWHEMSVAPVGAETIGHDLFRTGRKMKKAWKKPKVLVIAVGLEINSYACAELKK